MKDFPKDLSKIVEQLKSCHYQTSDALHKLENNTAFIALEEMASQSKESQNTIDNKSSVSFPDFEDAFGYICMPLSMYWKAEYSKFKKFYNIIVRNDTH